MSDPLKLSIEFEIKGGASLEAAQKALDNFAKSAGTLEGQTDGAVAGVTSLEKALDEALESLTSMDDASQEAGASVSDLGGDLSKAEAGLDKLADGAGGAGDGLDKVGASGESAGEGLSAAETKALQVGRSFESLRDAASDVGAGIEAVVSRFSSAALAAADFSQSMAEVATLSTDAQAQIGSLNAGVLEVSSSLGQDATQAANGLYNAISAGVPTDNAVSFLATAGKAAVAGVSDINTAVGALSVGLNAFNLDASETDRVSDALFTTVKLGVTNFGELGSAFGGVAGIAASTGASIEETLASLAQITTKGFGTAQAVTGLKAAFVSLSNPLVDAALKAQGFADGADAVKQIGLQGVFEAIRAEAEATGTPLIKLVGSSEAVNAILSTTGENAQGARDKLAEFGNTAGATAAAFDLISAEPAQKLRVFQESTKNLVITLGQALLPVMNAVLDVFTPLVQGATKIASVVGGGVASAFESLPGPIKAIVGGLAGILAISGAVIGSAVGMSLAIASLAKNFQGVAVQGSLAQKVLNSVTGTLNPLKTGLLSAGKSAVTAATSWGGLRSTIVGLGSSLVGGGGLTGALSAAGAAATSLGGASLGALGAGLGALVSPIGIVVAGVAAAAVAWKAADAALQEQLDTIEEGAQSFRVYAEASKTARQEAGLLGQLGFVLQDSIGAIGDKFALGADAAKGFASSAIASIKGVGADIAESLNIPPINLNIATNGVGSIIDAGQAFLELETNVAPATLESREFKLEQARLNEQLRDGKLTQDEYNRALLDAANAAQLAAGGERVLSEAQQERQQVEAGLLDGFAKNRAGLSDAFLATTAYTNTQKNLTEEIARGNITREQAQQVILGLAEAQDRATDAASKGLRTYATTSTAVDDAIFGTAEYTAKLEELSTAVAAGELTMDEARETLANWSSEVAAALASAAQGAPAFSEAFSGALQAFQAQFQGGSFQEIGIPITPIVDPEKAVEAVAKLNADLTTNLASGFQGLLDAEVNYNNSRGSLVSSNAERLTEAEKDAQKKISEAQESGNADRIAKAQQAAAERLQQISTENAERLAELDRGYQAERAQRIAQIGQAQVDYITGLVQTGQITSDKGKEILGALQQAFPTAEIASAANVAAIEIAGGVQAAVTGGAAELVALAQQGASSVQAVLDGSEEAVKDFEAETKAAFDAATSGLAENEVAIPIKVNSDGALEKLGEVATLVEETDERVSNSAANRALAIDASLGTELTKAEEVASGVEQAAARRWEADSLTNASAVQHADTIEEMSGRTQEQVILAAEARETASQREVAATTAAADGAKDGANTIAQASQTIADESVAAADAVEGSVGRVPDSFDDAASGTEAAGGRIVTSVAKTVDAVGRVGAEVPNKLSGADTAIDATAGKMENLARVQQTAGEVQIDAQEDAADTTEDASDTTVRSLGDVEDQAGATQKSIEELAHAFTLLPKLIEAEYRLLGVEKALSDLQRIGKDIDAATGTYTLTIRAAYIGQGPMTSGQSIQLQHDVEDAIAAAEPGVELEGRYHADHPFMEGDGSGLSLQSMLDDLADRDVTVTIRANLDEAARILFFDIDELQEHVRQAFEDGFGEGSKSINQLIDELERAQQAAEEARQAVADYGSILAAAFASELGQSLEAELALATSKAAGLISEYMREGTDLFNRVGDFPGLSETLERVRSQFLDGLGPEFFERVKIFDPDTLLPFSSLDEIRRRFEALADQPEKQRLLWEQVTEQINNGLTGIIQGQIDEIERVRDLLAADPAAGGTGSPAREALLQIANELRQTLDEIAGESERQARAVEDEISAYEYLTDIASERERIEKEALRALQDQLKALEDQIEDRRDLALDSEKDVHKQTLDLLDKEAKARERAFEAEMERIDELRTATEESIEASIAFERIRHEERLAAITAETDAEQAAIDAQKLAIDRAKDLITILETGGTLSDEQRGLLQQLGIDPQLIIEANKELNESREIIEDLGELIGKLPDVGRTRLAGRGGLATQQQLQQIREALDSGLVDRLVADGTISARARRLLEVALAGGEVQAGKLGEILAGITTSLEESGAEQEAQNDVADTRLKLLAAELEERQRLNDLALEGVEQQVEAEEAAFERYQERQRDRLDAIAEEEAAIRKTYDVFKAAIADAKEAERERHEARIKQIEDTFALELLRIELTRDPNDTRTLEEAWQEILDRAAAIAEEAERRFLQVLNGVGRVVADETTGAIDGITVIGQGAARTITGVFDTLIGQVRRIGSAIGGLGVEGAKAGGALAGAGTIGAEAFRGANLVIERGTEAIEEQGRALTQLERAMLNHERNRRARDAQRPLYSEIQTSVDFRRFRQGQRDAANDNTVVFDLPDIPPLPPLPLVIDGLVVPPAMQGPGGGLILPIDPVVTNVGAIGQQLAAAFAPADDIFGRLVDRAVMLRDIFTDTGFPIGSGDVSIDRSITFNGDVYLDDELAEELGLIDAARIGA